MNQNCQTTIAKLPAKRLVRYDENRSSHKFPAVWRNNHRGCTFRLTAPFIPLTQVLYNLTIKLVL